MGIALKTFPVIDNRKGLQAQIDTDTAIVRSQINQLGTGDHFLNGQRYRITGGRPGNGGSLALQGAIDQRLEPLPVGFLRNQMYQAQLR